MRQGPPPDCRPSRQIPKPKTQNPKPKHPLGPPPALAPPPASLPHLQSERRQQVRACLRELDLVPRAREACLQQLGIPIEIVRCRHDAFLKTNLVAPVHPLPPQT